MGPEVVNRNKNCVFYGPYAGRDLYIMHQYSEREFVVTHNANIKPVSYFTGRETELQELRQRIGEGRKSILVSGMGGIGKTQICRKLFEEYLNKHATGGNESFRHIGYIKYDGDMGSSLQNCLKFKQQDSPEQNQEAAWRELEYLASDGKLLLFVDNVDKSVIADSGLQRLKDIPAAIILTSRQVSFGNEFEPYRIGFLDIEQCIEIYEKIRFEGSARKIGQEEKQDLEYVIENLAGRHTITVELLAHLAYTKRWAVKRLRDELEGKGFRLTFHKDGELVNIQESYEMLYDLSMLTEAEQNILEAFSAFPYIPLAVETCNELLLADAGICEEDDILMGLYQKGWLQLDVDRESYALHPVFAQFIYEKCKPIMEKHVRLLDAFQERLKMQESDFVLKGRQYIPFARNILEKMEMEGSGKQFEFIKTFAGLMLHIGQYREAATLFNKLIEISGERGEDLSDMAGIYHSLACAYWFLGENEKAKKLFDNSLKIYETKSGDEQESIVSIYSNLAGLYVDERDYEKAEELYEKSLRICERMLGENHQATVTNYNNLALVYNRQGKYEKAEELYEKCLRMCEEMLGENHATTALCCYNLAEMNVVKRKYGKAEELYERSLKICERLYGENHFTTVNRYHKLALVYKKQGKCESAEELYQKSLKIYEKILEEDNPGVVTYYNDLAGLCYKFDDYKKAATYFFITYKICVFQFGLNHPHTQGVYKNMEAAFTKWKPEGNFELWLEEQIRASMEEN